MIMVADRTTLLPQTAFYSTRRRYLPFLLDWSTASISSNFEQLSSLEALELPGSDGVPMENDRERLQINFGLESLNEHWKERKDFFAGGNMFVYYSLSQAKEIVDEMKGRQGRKTAFRGPDMFVVLNIDGSYRRQKWVTWQEDGRTPDVIFEFLSPSTRDNDLGKKKRLYEQTFKTEEYFCFDYFNPEAEDSLVGFRLIAGHYQPIEPNEKGWLWSEKLGLWVGTWQGTYQRDPNTWMRFYTKEGDLVLIESEAEKQRADAEQQRADAEQQRAEAEKQRAEAAKQWAEAEKQRAEAEKQRAEAAEEELARLKALLAKQGVDLNS